MAGWEQWRSRKVLIVKPHKNGPEGQYYEKDTGRVLDGETLRREYEKLTPNETEEHSE